METEHRTIKVAAVQSWAEPSSVSRNLELLDETLDELAGDGVELALLPEFFPTGNTLEERILQVAIESGPAVEEWLRRRSHDLGMVLAGSYVAVDGGETYNRFVVVEPDGSAAHRDKRCSPAPEALYYTISDGPELVVSTGLGKIGLLMCIEMSETELVCHDFRDCALVLVCFAIPGQFPIPRRIRDRLTTVPPAIARRNGVPVLLSSMGGRFERGSSPIVPVPFSCDYAGRSGIYLPSGPVAEPLPPGAIDTIVADIPLGPAVAEPERDAPIDHGVPARVVLFDKVMLGRAQRIYCRNRSRLLG